MKILKGKVDENDVAYINERANNIVAVLPAPTGKGKINPHVTRFFHSDGQITDVFHQKVAYYLHRNGEWRPMGEVTLRHGNQDVILNDKWINIDPKFLNWLKTRSRMFEKELLIPTPYRLRDALIPLSDKIKELMPIGMTTTTFFPVPSVMVSGNTTRNGTNEVFTSLTAGAGTSADSATDNVSLVELTCTSISNQYTGLRRAYSLFDTSAIGAGQAVSAATLSWFGTYNGAALSQSLNICKGVPASNTALVAADFNIANHTFTQQATAMTMASWSATAYNDFVFNATGMASIAMTGVSKFTLIISADYTSTAPTWSSGADALINGYTANAIGTANDPKLVVTYAAASTSGNSNFFVFM